MIRQDFEQAFEQVDAILTPTSPTPAFKQGERNEDPIAMYLSDVFTISVNLAGIPGISIPCGFTGSGLPVGLQIIGQAFKESDMLAIAHAYDAVHAFGRRMPELSAK